MIELWRAILMLLVFIIVLELVERALGKWVAELLMCGFNSAWSVYFFVTGDTAWAALAAAVAGYCAWQAWKNRPKRKPRQSRVLGRVKNLGHRLVVVPE